MSSRNVRSAVSSRSASFSTSLLRPRQALSLAVTMALASFAGRKALAAAVVWDGGAATNVLETPANWVGDVLPSTTANDTMTWDGTVAGPLSLLYTSGLSGAIGETGVNINLTSTQTSAFTLDGSATSIRLNNVILDAGSGAFTLGNSVDPFAITLGGVAGQIHTWTNNSTNAATINSDVAFGLGGAGAHALAFAGSGNWVINNALAPSNGATLSIHKIGTGTLTLNNGGNWSTGVNAYGGTFGAVFKEGTTRITAGTYAMNATELVVGGLDTVGTNTQLIMDGGSITSTNWFSIGRGNGTGATSSDVILNGTSSIAFTNMSGGFNAGNASTAPKATVTLNDSSSITILNNVQIAESAGSNVTVTLNGNSTFKQTANANNTRIGMADNSVGSFVVNGGTASFERDFVLASGGNNSLGKLTINSGTFNMATTSERWFIMSQAGAGASSQLDMNGGTLNLNASADLRMVTNNTATATGTATVNMNGGTISGWTGNNNGVLSATSVLDLHYAAAPLASSFNLNGGTLAIGQVITTNKTAGTSAFNFNGGTLKAAASTANFINLMGTGQTVNVLAGGAKIDSNGADITVVDPLLNGTGGGADGGLSKSGAARSPSPASTPTPARPPSTPASLSSARRPASTTAPRSPSTAAVASSTPARRLSARRSPSPAAASTAPAPSTPSPSPATRRTPSTTATERPARSPSARSTSPVRATST
ncbi:MAG: hypothetical protein QM770_25135 [Tepidisphaeraceae bacterium]